MKVVLFPVAVLKNGCLYWCGRFIAISLQMLAVGGIGVI